MSPPHGGVDRNRLTMFGGLRAGGRPLTGAWIETRARSLPRAWRGVAPSRGRGSKLVPLLRRHVARVSPPHGGVDRNPNATRAICPARWSPPHGGVDRNDYAAASAGGFQPSPPHGGVDRNKLSVNGSTPTSRRPLTGAWIETRGARPDGSPDHVAPSRGRGSKRRGHCARSSRGGSPPHGGVDRNSMTRTSPRAASRRPLTGAWIETCPSPPRADRGRGRPLTGAWIETSPSAARMSRPTVAPSRGRGSKPYREWPAIAAAARRPLTGAWIETASRAALPGSPVSPPHGGVDRNSSCARRSAPVRGVAPSRGRGSKRQDDPARIDARQSPPHGGVDRNTRDTQAALEELVAPSRGRGSKRQSR